MRLEQAGPLPGLGARGVATLGVAELNAGPCRELLDSLAEAQMIELDQKVEDVASCSAAEAVEQPPSRRDMEGRGSLLMEGTQTHQAARASAAQGHPLPHDIGDRRTLADEGDVLVPNSAGHDRSLRASVACPGSLDGCLRIAGCMARPQRALVAAQRGRARTQHCVAAGSPRNVERRGTFPWVRTRWDQTDARRPWTRDTRPEGGRAIPWRRRPSGRRPGRRRLAAAHRRRQRRPSPPETVAPGLPVLRRRWRLRARTAALAPRRAGAAAPRQTSHSGLRSP